MVVKNPKIIANNKSPLSSEMRQLISDVIIENGYFIGASTTALNCPNEENKYNQLYDCYIYTIGRKALNQPDLLFLCGPTPYDGDWPHEQLYVAALNAMKGITMLIENYHTTNLKVDDKVEVSSGRIYVVHDDNDFIIRLKKEFANIITTYYGTEEYSLLVLMPANFQTLH